MSSPKTSQVSAHVKVSPMQMVHEEIVSIKKVAKRIDDSLPTFLQKLNAIESRTLSAEEFPYESWSKLQGLKREICGIKENCCNDYASIQESTTILSKLNNCATISLKFLQHQVNGIETALSTRGYVPVEILKSAESTKPVLITTKEEQFSASEQDDKTYTVGNLKNLQHTKSETFIPDEIQNVKENAPPGELSSPQLPSICFASRQSDNLLSPTLPSLSSHDVKTLTTQSSYFESVTSPNIQGISRQTAAKKTMTNASFFPNIGTPKTPEICVGEQERLKVADSEETPDSERLVLHSRKSLLTCYRNDDPPDSTLFELRSFKAPVTTDVVSWLTFYDLFWQPDMSSAIAYCVENMSSAARHSTPDTPNLKQLGIMNPDLRQNPSYHRESTRNCFDSPLVPELERSIEQSYRPPACRRKSCWIEEESYESLPASLKRLFSLEQANAALHSITLHAAETSKGQLTDEDMREATSLGGKTQSCILLLTTLGVIWKVPGTNLYAINE